ncbi:6-phosphofructokinase [Haploplasma modicum]|jgi:ATP-dependent phosphofructokinase / diphosphate-dependent phosphofructokinase|uniref:6-phosphofructokinase n=1 Tax=Haploplasma modicum TaxID=2150 RepID=UPI0004798D6A|nr:6-phosphofructokinase [Haploplasma modicum]MCR1809289.1 6-phosphofructokinase [Haploplasma modicum]
MKELKGAVLLGQSGGPTSVINASAAGVFLAALDSPLVTEVYGAVHGIRGVLNEEFYDMRQEDRRELELLKNTPSSSIGSVRYKLADPKKDDTDYKRLLEVFKKYNIRFFFYNGGNDSMDTASKINDFMRESGWDMRVMGVPKTIDNDLFGTDHSPGFASAAKYVATTFMELYHDATVYDTKQVTIVEVMGRNAGWLTAASQLAKSLGQGPDLIFLPEVDFDLDFFNKRVKEVLDEKGKVIVAISEGLKTKEGKYIPELFKSLSTDSFGHAQLGGAAAVLADEIKQLYNVKVRPIEFSLMQRSAAHLASGTDVNEAYNAGRIAVESALKGESGKMVGFKRLSSAPYEMEYVLLPLSLAANTEQTVPLEWILPNAEGLSQEFVDYALPLIQGDAGVTYENGLPRFAKLKKVRAPKL